MTKAQILKAIRKQCLACCGGSAYQVAKCDDTDCSLFALRFGKDPKPSKAKIAQGKQLAKSRK